MYKILHKIESQVVQYAKPLPSNAIFAHGDNVILWEADLVAAKRSGCAWQLRFVLVGWRKTGIEGIVERCIWVLEGQ
jgi:hypothetical protein